MQTFPRLTRLDDLLPHIEDRKEFFVAERPEFLIVDYTFVDKTTFQPDSEIDEAALSAAIRRECRGLKFDKADRSIIGRAYHKFFNVGEWPELTPERIDWRRDHVVLEKLDGSMVHASEVEGRLVFATRMGATPTARRALAHARAAIEVDYEGFCLALLRQGFTPVFEWCSPEDRVVLGYRQDDLILTALRSLDSGSYLPWPELQRLSSAWGLPLVPAHPVTLEDPLAFIDEIRGLEDSEGCVVRFAEGEMLKLKTEDYTLRHSLLTDIRAEKFALRVVLQGRDDDARALLPPPQAAALAEYALAVQSGLRATAARLRAFVETARARSGGDRKAFALAVQAELPPQLQGAAFRLWLGAEPLAALTEAALKGLRSQTAVDAVRPLWGAAVWADFLSEAGSGAGEP